jgi:hypothetical protein
VEREGSSCSEPTKRRIMGKVFRVLCGLIVIMLAGHPVQPDRKQAPVFSKKPMVVVTIDPETGSVVAVRTTVERLEACRGNDTKVGTPRLQRRSPSPLNFSRSPPPHPLQRPVRKPALPQQSAPTIYTCVVIINGVPFACENLLIGEAAESVPDRCFR